MGDNRRMRKRIAFLVALVIAPAAYAADPAGCAASVVEQYFRAHSAPATSLAVAAKGQLVVSRGWGFAELDNAVPATGATVYNIGSISKVNTAVAVMQLVEDKKVSLDDAIQKYVQGFPDKGSPITIRNVMTHTSGIRHYREHDFPGGPYAENMMPYASIDDAIKVFKDDPLLFKPGEFYSYSSYAVNLLQGVVERASGLPFEDYMRRYVWLPAGMQSTQFDRPERIVAHRARGYRVKDGKTTNEPYGDVSYKLASGGVISTVEDLVRLGTALNEGRLLKPQTAEAMYAVQIDPVMAFNAGGPPRKQNFQMALLWREQHDEAGRRFVHHCGSVKSFQSCLVNFPDQNVVAAVAGNSDDGPGLRTAIDAAHCFLEAGQ